MQYGIYYSYWERDWGADPLKYVEKVARLGFDILEIPCAPLPDMTEAQLDALQDQKERWGISLTAGCGPKAEHNIASPDPAVVQRGLTYWRTLFPILHRLGISLVGGGLYHYWPVDYRAPVDKPGDWARSVAGVRQMADMAAAYGITLGMEVLNRHEGYLLNVAEEGATFVDQVERNNVKVMLDTYHMNMEEEDMSGAIQTAGHRLGHFHIGEVNRRLPGQGHRVDWAGIAAALQEVGYEGAVVMEPFVIAGGQVGTDIRLWRDLSGGADEAKLDRDAAESVAFVRKVFEGNTQ